jgi:GT2 family glycosyltransferase
MADPLPVALAVMTAGDIRMECVEGIGSSIATQTVSQFWITQSGPYLDNGRNNVVKTFQDPQVRERCTHLLMVDSDIGFTPDDVIDLYDAAQDRAVVSGVYYSSFSGFAQPIIYDWAENELGMKTLSVIDHWEDGWSFWNQKPNREGIDPLVKVQAAGAGFLMIRYEVIDVLESVHGEPQPWFDEPVIDGIHFGEDLAFCMRVKDAGFSVWAHRDVEVAHYKNTVIGPIAGSKVAP